MWQEKQKETVLIINTVDKMLLSAGLMKLNFKTFYVSASVWKCPCENKIHVSNVCFIGLF